MIKDINDLSDLSWGYRAARVLQVASQLEIFTILAGRKMSAGQISEKCRSNPEMTGKLLTACAAMGLLYKNGDKYRNSEVSEKCLVKGQPLYQGNIIAHAGSVWDFWSDLPNEIYKEQISQDRLAFDHRDFILGMHNITVAGRGQMFIDNIDLSGRKILFDVGGGPGTYSILACKRYLELRAVVFDVPETISIAREIVAKEKLQDRITLREGDWDRDDFGRDNDVILFSNVLHGPPSQGPVKLSKAYDSMAAGGLLVIQDFLLNDSKSGLLIPALFNIMVGAYCRGELLSIIEEAGFGKTKIIADSEELGCTWITAEKP